MADLHELIEDMTPEQKQTAILVLDAVSRPMTAREIEGVLRGSRVSRSRATILASVLKDWHLIAMMGPEHG
ncbi:MAG: hypothetical protein WKF52_08930 [Sphingomicrobium sp.]